MSWSMVSLVVTLAAALVLGLSVWGPVWARGDLDVAQIPPGLLTVDAAARGQVTLGDGFTASMQPSGFRIARYDDVLLDTVTRGSLLSVLTGRSIGQSEDITSSVSNLLVSSLAIRGAEAIWTGTAYGPGGVADHSVPVRVAAALDGTTVRVDISATGADGLVVHLDPRPATTGVPPALPERNLRKRAWWVTGTAPVLFDNVLGARVGLDAAGAPRAVDLRPDGLLDLHAWSGDVVLTVAPGHRPAVAHS